PVRRGRNQDRCSNGRVASLHRHWRQKQSWYSAAVIQFPAASSARSLQQRRLCCFAKIGLEFLRITVDVNRRRRQTEEEPMPLLKNQVSRRSSCLRIKIANRGGSMTMTKMLCSTALMVATFLGQAWTQTAKQSVVFVVSGQPGQAAILQLNGRSYVDIEALARLTGGSLSFQGNQTTLKLPASSASA